MTGHNASWYEGQRAMLMHLEPDLSRSLDDRAKLGAIDMAEASELVSDLRDVLSRMDPPDVGSILGQVLGVLRALVPQELAGQMHDVTAAVDRALWTFDGPHGGRPLQTEPGLPTEPVPAAEGPIVDAVVVSPDPDADPVTDPTAADPDAERAAKVHSFLTAADSTAQGLTAAKPRRGRGRKAAGA